MQPLHLLIQAETQSAQARVAAVTANVADLHALHDALNARHADYCSLFEPLIEAAQPFALDIPEVHSCGLHEDRHRWGNSGLKGVSHKDDGFTRIVTFDSFRGESSTFVAYIPTRYLGLDGEALMHADAARIKQDIEARRQARAAEDAAALEQHERAELARLQTKFA